MERFGCHHLLSPRVSGSETSGHDILGDRPGRDSALDPCRSRCTALQRCSNNPCCRKSTSTLVFCPSQCISWSFFWVSSSLDKTPKTPKYSWDPWDRFPFGDHSKRGKKYMPRATGGTRATSQPVGIACHISLNHRVRLGEGKLCVADLPVMKTSLLQSSSGSIRCQSFGNPS